MALDINGLASGLAKVFKSKPSSAAQAASKIADEYDKYCKKGQAIPGLPVFTGMEKSKLKSLLTTALGLPNRTSAMVATAFSQGILAYWTAPPVVFVGGPATGVVTGMLGAGAVVAAITAALMNLTNSEETIGASIAAALDTATKTVIVTYSTPPPPTGPPPPAFVM